jgi:hypothetical protein
MQFITKADLFRVDSLIWMRLKDLLINTGVFFFDSILV